MGKNNKKKDDFEFELVEKKPDGKIETNEISTAENTRDNIAK